MAGDTYVLYARLSKNPDGTIESVARQVREMQAELERTGDKVGEIFVDDGRSAWKKSVVREGFEKLFKTIAAGQRHVMIWHVDRWTRNPWDLERLIRVVEHDVEIRQMHGRWNLRNPDDQLILRFFCMVACHSSGDTSRRMKSKLRERTTIKNLPLGPRHYGRNLDGTVNEQEAQVLREAAKRWVNGETWMTIAADLTVRGIRSLPKEKVLGGRRVRVAEGVPLTRHTLREMVIHPRNTGVIIHNGKPAGRMVPIFDPQLAEEVGLKLTTRSPGAQPSGRFALTGYVVCDRCGGLMGGTTVRGRRMYRCDPRATGQQCSASVVADAVEALVGEHVTVVLGDPDYRDQIQHARVEATSEADRLAQKVSKLRGRLALLVITQDALGPAFQSAYLRLTTQIATTEAQLAAVREPQAVRAAAVAHAEALWAEAGEQMRRRYVEALVTEVRIVPANRFDHPPQRAFDPRRVQVTLALAGAQAAAAAAG